MDTADYPPGILRASDADRDRAIAELAEHFQAGRLTADELDDRTGRALAARTGGELAGLLADLPRQPPAVTASTARWLPGRLVPAAVLVAAAVLSVSVSGHHVRITLIPVLVAFFVVRRLAGGRRRVPPAAGSGDPISLGSFVMAERTGDPVVPRAVAQWGWLVGRLGYAPFQDWPDGARRAGPVRAAVTSRFTRHHWPAPHYLDATPSGGARRTSP